MKQLLCSLIVCSLLFSVSAFGSQTVLKILEQSENGDSTHRALDRSTIGDGLDPILQFILLEAPTDPRTAQVVWEASESPIPWARSAEEQPYQMVEYALLPDGAELEYRVYVQATGQELGSRRHTRSEEDDTYGVDGQIIDDLPDGEYSIHVRMLIPDRPTKELIQRIDVTEFPPVNELDNLLGAGVETILPGSGWDGPTETPAQIGNRHERAIAHWNVVPEQSVSDGFQVGVIAHHLDGIDRVEIAANGGEWIKITEPSFNPRTKCQEYWAELDLQGQDIVELRAIAYPKRGKPYVVKVVDEIQGVRLYGSARGSVLELPAGRHRLLSRDLPTEGWLTIRPAPGVSREDCIIYGDSRFWPEGNLHVQGLTWETPPNGRFCNGENDTFNRIWIDDVDIQGNPETLWLAGGWSQSIYTDTQITDTNNVFNNAGQLFVRNVHIGRVYQDIFRSSGGLVVNLKVDRIDRGPYTDYHADFLQSKYAGNCLMQDVEAMSLAAQGIFPQKMENSAFVRVNLQTDGVGKVIQLQGTTQNTLFKDCNFVGPGILRESLGFNVPKGERLVFEDTKVGREAPYLPSGWNLPGVFFRQNNKNSVPNPVDDR